MWDMAKKQTKAAGIEWRNIKVKLGALQPWGHNPRSSTKKQAARILESFNTFGQVQTIAVGPAFEVYDGHQRLSALLTMHGAGYEIDARQSARALTDDERRRLVVALHAGAQGAWDWDSLSGWDESLLKSAGMDNDLLAQMNRDATALRAMLEADAGASDVDAEPQIDKADELREKWQTARGQVWQLGDHRLMCGDSTSADDVARLMGGDVAELLFTSPPYADMREYKGGDLTVEKLAQFIPTFKPHARYQVVNLGIKREKGEFIQYWDTYITAAKGCGYKLLSWNVWDQGQNGAVGKLTAMFPIEHEWMFVFGQASKDLMPTVPNKDAGNVDAHVYDRQSNGKTAKKGAITIRPKREIGTVARVPPQLARNVDASHPAMFPIGIAVSYIEAMTKAGDFVADPFSGSGTTIIACEQLGRKCRAMEISPAYVAVALQRWADATGKTPALIES
jgi:DNA modification methylase